MNPLIKKICSRVHWNDFLKVSTLAVFGLCNIKAQVSQQQIALITVGVLFLGFIIVFIWGKAGSRDEA